MIEPAPELTSEAFKRFVDTKIVAAPCDGRHPPEGCERERLMTAWLSGYSEGVRHTNLALGE